MYKNLNIFFSIKPERSPLFYGYIIALVGTLGVWASLPGQTVGVSTFTDPVKDALGLSRDQISNAYTLGTIISSFFIGFAGKWYDKYGAKWVAFFASIGLAISLFLCSQSELISKSVQKYLGSTEPYVPLVTMIILFFLLRFSGQGVLTLASRNMIMKWFDRLRGRINAFSAIAVSLGFSASPIFISKLIDNKGWQNAWLLMALSAAIFSIVVFLFFRDKPEDFGLLPDGKKVRATDNKDASDIQKKQFTLAEAKKTRAFWMYSFGLAFYSFYTTGLTFHIFSIFKNSGYNSDQAISIFIPMSFVAVTVSLFANFLSDWIKLKSLLFLHLAGGILASLGLIFLSEIWGKYTLILGNGLMGGLFSVLVAVAWPRFFGRKFLGATSGKMMSMIVLASALGPSLFSYSNTLFKTYAGVGMLSVAFLIVISLASLKANNPQ